MTEEQRYIVKASQTSGLGIICIVWCRKCGHQGEPDPAEMAGRYGFETTVPEWHKRLVCLRCVSHDTDMVVTGEWR